MELSEKAKQAKREYYRRYYQAHKEKIKENHRLWWERKALQLVTSDENI